MSTSGDSEQAERPLLYILSRDGTPVPLGGRDDGGLWARWREENHARCLIALSHIHKVKVSTIFTGIDARTWDADAAPLLYESIVFGERGDVIALKRYATRAEALQGHEHMTRVARGLPD